jgi:hypothetical protein
MHRTQILLDEWQYASLKSVADHEDRSISQLVREAISAYLGSYSSYRAEPESSDTLPPGEEIARVWAREALRRDRAIRRGEETETPAGEVFATARAALGR